MAGLNPYCLGQVKARNLFALTGGIKEARKAGKRTKLCPIFSDIQLNAERQEG